MTTERTALMLEPTCEHCQYCSEAIIGEPLFTDLNVFGEPFCSLSCIYNWTQSENEAASERIAASFYGG